MAMASAVALREFQIQTELVSPTSLITSSLRPIGFSCQIMCDPNMFACILHCDSYASRFI
jgi:hypothetical protein